MEKIAVIGLGYVGLPLAVELAKVGYKVVGFDINEARVAELVGGTDKTLEVSESDLASVAQTIQYSAKVEDMTTCNIFIVTVPTPIDGSKNPDLRPLVGASQMLSPLLKKGDIVIYESTVYPGCTEEICVPELESNTSLKYNVDFFCGYSPERINPGDKVNTLTTIKKVTSGSTPEVADRVDALYNSVIKAGTFKATSIKVAEASKAIENAQRDVNISFVNELSLIFDRIGIDTHEVLEAAGTKWNFLPFKPGLVGGHCIGVDPYYLAAKAESLGYHPEVILSGRRINDNMGVFVGNKVIKLLIDKGNVVKGANALVLGITFKENCPDIRNTKVVDVVRELEQFGLNVDVYDPWASAEEVKEEYNIDLLSGLNGKQYDAVVLTVSHEEFRNLDMVALTHVRSVVFDTKAFLPKEVIDGRL